jgi:hypothetical protein
MELGMRKSDTYIDKWGNIRYCDSNKTRARAVMERFFGHPLSPGSVVHHKNRDKTDNRASNLWVFKNQKAHDRVHRKDKKRFGHW